MGLKTILRKVANLVNKVPGEKYFGIYRFLPFFFISGAVLEYSMIHWRPHGINFYDKFKHKNAHEIALEKYNRLKEIESLTI